MEGEMEGEIKIEIEVKVKNKRKVIYCDLCTKRIKKGEIYKFKVNFSTYCSCRIEKKIAAGYFSTRKGSCVICFGNESLKWVKYDDRSFIFICEKDYLELYKKASLKK